LNIVNDNIGPAFMTTSKLNDSILWHARLVHVHYKRMQDMSKDGDLCDQHATPSLANNKYLMTFIDDASRFCYVYLLHTKDEALDKFKVFKIEVALQQGSLIKRFRTDRRGEYMDTLYFQFVGIIYEMTAPYTPQQNGISERKNKVLKEMVNFMLSYSGLSQGAVVRLSDPKLKTLGERGIKRIFVGYANHFKSFRFYVIEPNESVSNNSLLKSRDAIFDKNRFSSVSRPSLRIPNETEDIGGTRDEVSDQHSYLVNVEDDPKAFDEAMKSQDVTFWKEEINDEMDSIMGNNTWVLTDRPPGCKPFGCKWIFKRKMKVDGTIEKFKARLVIQGFRQKSRIDYFDTYASVARISTIRLLIALASIHSLIIHQMDVNTAFLNGEMFSMKDMGEADVIVCIRIKHEMSTPMDKSKKLMPNNGQAVSQLEYSRVIGCLMYVMTCTRPDIAFIVGKQSMYTSNLDISSTSGWVFLLGGGAISWASKKQTCITSSMMESEFLALAAASKEVEFLRNLILEVPLWYGTYFYLM
ncbi:zinc finger, CCHC-type containing protein, partial [Tanacetum coccineum]